MRRKINKGLFALVFIVLFDAISFAEDFMLYETPDPTTIGFIDAIRLALSNNLNLKKIEQNIVAAKGEALLVASRLLPHFSAAAEYGSVSGSSTQEQDHTRVGLKATIPLIDGKTIFDMKAKHKLFLSAQDNFRSEQEALINVVGDLYIEAYILKVLSDNAKEEKEIFHKQLSAFERRAQVGAARNLDLRRAQYLAAKANSDYVLKHQDFLKKMGELGLKLGMRNFFQIGTVSISSPHVEKDAETLMAMACDSYDLASLKNEVSAAKLAIIGERMDFFPKLKMNLDGGWPLMIEKNRFARADQFSLELRVSLEIPIFTGASSLASMKILHSKESIAALSLQEKLQEKRLAINGLLKQNQDLLQAKASAELAVEAASLAKESADRMFQKNEATGIELAEAHTHHFAAKNLLASTILKLEQAKLRLLLVIGRLRELID